MSENLTYQQQEQLLKDALEYKRQYPSTSLRKLEKYFPGIKKDKLSRRLRGLNGSHLGQRPANCRLTKEQDEALCEYLRILIRFGHPLRTNVLQSVATELLQIDNLDIEPVSRSWAPRWKAAHLEFKFVKEKPIEQARKEAISFNNIKRWFRELEATITKYRILKEDF
jgi:hypothetical protein